MEDIMSLFKLNLWQRKAAGISVLVSFLIVVGCSRNAAQFLVAGQKYMNEGKYAEASIELRNAIRLDSRMVEAHYQLAVAFLGMGLLADANTELSTVIGLNANHLDAQLIQGN